MGRTQANLNVEKVSFLITGWAVAPLPQNRICTPSRIDAACRKIASIIGFTWRSCDPKFSQVNTSVRRFLQKTGNRQKNSENTGWTGFFKKYVRKSKLYHTVKKDTTRYSALTQDIKRIRYFEDVIKFQTKSL
jgi:hypothetical protein